MYNPKDDDEEFVVIKAGPPLPIRRPRPRKPSLPLTPYELPKPPIKTSSSIPVAIPTLKTPTGPAPLIPATLSNKMTQTIVEKSQPLKPFGGASGTGPQPVLKSRPPTPTLQVESKVRQYIEQVKKADEINRAFRKDKKPEKYLSLEDLYQVSTIPVVDTPKDKGQVEERLRQTLRIIKEKDEMIDKLRESCHELKLKWADAENRVDEMRFGFGGKGDRRASQGQGQGSLQNLGSFKDPPRRSVSAINLSDASTSTGVMGTTKESGQGEKEVLKKDQATETDRNSEKSKKGEEEKMPKSHTTEGHREEDLDEFDLDELLDLDSNFDPVLEEKCSHWLEKVQNWKTDSALHLSQDKDSCGDRDSGFRGSAELEHQNPTSKKQHRQTHRISKSKSSKSKDKSEGKLTTEESAGENNQTLSKSPTPDRVVCNCQQKANQKELSSTTTPTGLNFDLHPQQAVSSSATVVTHDDHLEESGPSSLHIAQPWHTFCGNVNPQSSTEYQGFPSLSSSSYNINFTKKYELSAAKSMDALNLYQSFEGRSPKSIAEVEDQKQLLRSVDKRFKTLNPLLDEATAIALRVRKKSEKLAKILRDKNIRGGSSSSAADGSGGGCSRRLTFS